jgi:hypothetical protein
MRGPCGGASGASGVVGCEQHHRTEYVARVHLVERRLDAAERDLLGHERVEVEPALQVEVDQHREVPRRQAVAVPAGLQ